MPDISIPKSRSGCKQSLPMRRDGFNVQAFLVWLSGNGAEIGMPTNPYEVVRYRAYVNGGNRAATHIVYAKDNGVLTWCGMSMFHYEAFLQEEALPGSFAPQFDVAKPKTPIAYPRQSESDTSRTRKALLKRDGDECWFCGKPMGEDATIEHLVPKSKGGRNTLDNYALAHAKCNHSAGNKPLVEKIAMRTAMRLEHEL